MIRISIFSRLLSRQLFTRQVMAASHCQSPSQQVIRKFSAGFRQLENEKSLIASQDSDTFGTLSPDVTSAEADLEDEGDIKEEEYIKNPPSRSQKLSTKQYAEMIKHHLNNRQIKEALDVLELRMLKEDRIKPENYIFNLLIDGCAREGYSKKAFYLFTKMRQRGLKVTGSTYTSLFNACANAPWKEDGLAKATRLRQIMLEKGFEANVSNYNAMIKAFGRCNDLKTAFQLVDEMTDKQLNIDVSTFNFLLQACVSDKEFGFRHALLVWHKMHQRKLNPDIYSFNLLLRCCRDTGFGDVESMEEVLQTILLKNSSEDQLRIEAGKDDKKLLVESDSPGDVTPNLLALRPHLGSLITLAEVKKPEDKLILLGGFVGFLEAMKNSAVKPDLKTYTELIEVIPATTAAEKRLLKKLKKDEIKCDVDFFNVLMKKRCMRFDYSGAREVLEMIEQVNLEPDIVTYGVLALSCQSHEEAQALIREMDEKGIKMNIPILGAMVKTACVTKNFDYVIDVLNIVSDLKLKPSDQMLNSLDIFIKSCNKIKKGDIKRLPKNFRENFHTFKQKLESWKEKLGLKDLELDEAKKILKDPPWEQFQSVQADGYEDRKSQKLKNMKKYKRYIGKIKNLE